MTTFVKQDLTGKFLNLQLANPSIQSMKQIISSAATKPLTMPNESHIKIVRNKPWREISSLKPLQVAPFPRTISSLQKSGLPTVSIPPSSASVSPFRKTITGRTVFIHPPSNADNDGSYTTKKTITGRTVTMFSRIPTNVSDQGEKKTKLIPMFKKGDLAYDMLKP